MLIWQYSKGAYGIMQLGTVAMKIFPKTGTLIPNAGEIFYTVGVLVALIMWGFGLVWLFFALASIVRSRFPFNIGWWGFTFPIGVYTLATNQFGKEIPSKFFSVFGTVCDHGSRDAIRLQMLTDLPLDIIDRRHHTLDHCSTQHHSAFSDGRTFLCALFAGLENEG